MNIKVLGPAPGDISRKTLYSRTKEALKELNFELNVEEVGYMEDLKKYRALAFPALVINETVVASGRPVPTKEKIKSLLREAIKPEPEKKDKS